MISLEYYSKVQPTQQSTFAIRASHTQIKIAKELVCLPPLTLPTLKN